MNENRKTITLGAVAAALLGLTLLTAPRHKPAGVFDDQGRPFYPEFADPLRAASLEVVEFDEATASPKRFKVALVAGKWVIPSHHNYPADAKDWAKRAATFIDLKRDKFRSDSAAQYESFGVVDPADEKAQGTKGRGKRVTLRDLDGKVLADFIFGKDAPEGRRYVRLPDQNQKRVYETRTKAEVSTKFEDWIETDLLQLNQSAIRKVVVDKYSIDEQQLAARGVLMIKDRTTTTVSREDSAKPWQVSGMKEKEEPNTENLSSMASALDDLKIVGVRPKPPFLTRDLKASGEFKVRERLTPQQMASLQSLQQRGFFVVPQGEESHVLSNEGDITVSCEDGVVYTLRFGEVLIGEGEEVSAGAPEDKKDPAKKDEKKTGKEARYLLVTTRFDESLLGAAPVEPKAPEKKPEEKKPEEKKPEEKKDDKQAEKKPEEKKPEAPEQEQYKKDKEEYDRKKTEYDKKIADGKKRTQELTDRFADWYYVISDDLFKKLRRDPKELVKPKEEKKEEKKDEHKHDEKKPEDKKPEEKKPEEKKSEEKKN